ncbi:hypothetical protein cypCar_00036349 [Cyprinus carpio]|nr:hypothetical protein cypCar_00036349 [Cyprinus carpio]
MRRKQKRLLQIALLLLLAFLLLPNIGLWSASLERMFDSSADAAALSHAQRMNTVQNAGVRRKDWHDHALMKSEAARSGVGEQGRPYPLTDSDRVDQAYRENGFNIFVSNRISLNRSLPDIRHPNCKMKLYAEDLPNTSIIIPFHNEGWSSLLRTVHSVLNRSPPQLIAEIILVDDFSDKEHLKAPLEEYMVRLPKVRILRTKKREGLIRTRLLGAAAAKGQVITFLDSHCEANVNWLPPLLDRIAENRKTIVCPMIDVIDHDNFAYETQAGDAMRGAFDWEMYYKRIPIPAQLQKPDPSDPFDSSKSSNPPLRGDDRCVEWVCVGVICAVVCEFEWCLFFFSVRSPVMAGGLFAVDRKWFWELGGYDTGLEIWGGEQYEISFKVWMCGGRMEDIPCSRVGHIYRKYVPYKVPGGVSLARLRNGASGLCMESKHFSSGSPIRLEKCLKGGGEPTWSHGQVFTFGWREDIRVGDPLHTKKVCFDAVSHNSPVTLYDCHGMKGNQLWAYRKKRIFMNSCDPSSPSQRWLFQNTNTTVLDSFNSDHNV